MVLLVLAGPAGRVLGWVLRVHPLLVGRHVLRTRWRSAAVVTALALCLTLVVAANTETESILAATKLPTSFPDLLVILPDGVERAEAAKALEELDAPDWTGLNGFDIEMVGYRDRGRSTMGRTLTQWRRGNTWYLALDPQQMAHLAKLDFVRGDPAEARRRLAEGDTIIVTQAFARKRGLGFGDTMRVLDYDRKIVPLEIVGVIGGLSLEVAGTAYNLGELYLQHAELTVLGSSVTAVQRFQQDNYSILLIDADSPAESDAIASQLRLRWRDRPVEHVSLARLKAMIESDARKLVLIFSLIGGLLTAAVASAGVANAMQASVHSRRHDLGVLHAVGMERGALVRLILAEALVLGLAGAILGTATGVYASHMSLKIYELLTSRGVAVAIPWSAVGISLAVAVTATVTASVAAAVRAGRANVLDLMHE